MSSPQDETFRPIGGEYLGPWGGKEVWLTTNTEVEIKPKSLRVC